MSLSETRLGGDATGLPAVEPSPPLPSLATAFSRRRAIFGVTALAVAPVGLLPAVASVDPFVGYHQEILDLFAAMDGNEDDSDEAIEPFMNRWHEIDELGRTTRPTTLSGAINCLEWARREHVQFHMEEDESDEDPGERLILALLDGALGVLRQRVGGGVHV